MQTVIDYLTRVAEYDWWRVAVELFVIGMVVYWAVDFLEGTRGEKLFRSVIFILIAGAFILNLVAKQLDFPRLLHLYKGFLIFILVITVAAFQPEIRRALIRIGQPRFLTSSTRQLERTVEQIITAVTEMSADKTGAIIVIEKRVALGELTETGVRLDAKVSAELLKTVFKSGSALHDMAVIIRSDRIEAARVQLPLAEAGSIQGVELGSRHRAAIGITTGSDASVIVVSEETGIISIAQNGNLTRNVTKSDLRKHLTSTIGEMATIAERFWKFPRKTSIKTTEDNA